MLHDHDGFGQVWEHDNHALNVMGCEGMWNKYIALIVSYLVYELCNCAIVSI